MPGCQCGYWQRPGARWPCKTRPGLAPCRFKNISVILDAVVASMDVLVMMAFLLFVLLVSFAAVIYFMEHDTNPNIYSIPQAMYFIQVGTRAGGVDCPGTHNEEQRA